MLTKFGANSFCQPWDSFFHGGPKVGDDFLPERASQPIGVNDLHIAGHARSEGLVLVTNNMSEFVGVPALEVENWVHPGQ